MKKWILFLIVFIGLIKPTMLFAQTPKEFLVIYINDEWLQISKKEYLSFRSIEVQGSTINTPEISNLRMLRSDTTNLYLHSYSNGSNTSDWFYNKFDYKVEIFKYLSSFGWHLVATETSMHSASSFVETEGSLVSSTTSSSLHYIFEK